MAAELMQQLSALSQAGAREPEPVPQTVASHGSGHGWPPRKKTLEEEDEERYGCCWQELEEKLRFHPNWEVRRDTLYYVRDNARKKDPRVMATLKHMARRDPNVNVKMAAAEILVHVGLQTLPNQIWMLGHEDWFTRYNAIHALEFAAEPEDDAVMTALSLSMQDASANVRESAIQSLMFLARKRKNAQHQFPPFVLKQLLERLCDEDSRVRSSAADGIVEVASWGDRELVQDLAHKMTSRVTVIRRGASEVLKKLCIKFNEMNDRSMRPADPEASPLAQIQKFLLHPDVSVQRAALDAMQAISASTCSLYTAADEVVARNKADMQGEVGHVQFDGCREDKQPASAIASPLSPSSLGSRLMTGISVMTGASSAHDQSSAADAGGNAETAAVGVGVENMDSDSEEGEGKGDEDENLQSPVKAAPPQVRRQVLPIAFRKELAAAISRGATAAPEPQSGF